MNTKLLMTFSASFMALCGVAATFAPQEILGHFGFSEVVTAVLFMQVTGALFLGFAVLNWTARSNLIGGIYSRPVGLGNFVHFAVVAIGLAKLVLRGGLRNGESILFCGIYVLFAAAFGWVVFTHPRPQT